MGNIENTAVNDLIARVSGRARTTSSRMPAVVVNADPARTTFSAAMPVAAPFETHPGQAWTAAPMDPDPALPAPDLAPSRLQSAGTAWPQTLDGTQLHELVEGSHERLVPTFQMRRRRPTPVSSVLRRLVFPVALLVSIGVVIGTYVAVGGERVKLPSSHETAPAVASRPAIQASVSPPAAPRAAAAKLPTVVASPVEAAPVPAAHEPVAAAPAPAPAPAAHTSVVAAAAAPAAPAPVASAPASGAAGLMTAPAAVPSLVTVRIESTPSGATVMLVDRGRTQFVGTTPIDTAVDPSREYDLVLTSEDQPPRVEHLDARATQRVAVALTRAEHAERSAEPPVERPAERPTERQVERPAAASHRSERASEAATARASRSRGEAGEGTRMISSKPPCAIVIDGRPTGLTTPQRSIALPAGSHRVTLINSEKSIKKTVAVQIAANATEKVIEDLMK
jgi:hypothetical protein